MERLGKEARRSKKKERSKVWKQINKDYSGLSAAAKAMLRPRGKAATVRGRSTKNAAVSSFGTVRRERSEQKAVARRNIVLYKSLKGLSSEDRLRQIIAMQITSKGGASVLDRAEKAQRIHVRIENDMESGRRAAGEAAIKKWQSTIGSAILDKLFEEAGGNVPFSKDDFTVLPTGPALGAFLVFQPDIRKEVSEATAWMTSNKKKTNLPECLANVQYRRCAPVTVKDCEPEVKAKRTKKVVKD